MEKEDEMELQEAFKILKLKKKIIGVGGAGCNIVRRVSKIGIPGVELIAMDVDAEHLDYIPIENKLLIGRDSTEGFTCSSEELGRAACEEERSAINDMMEKTDIVFILCGLGGGTGTGAAPLVAEIAKEQGTLVFAICVLPFKAEGTKRTEKARGVLEELKKTAETVVSIKNDILLENYPDLSTIEAFSVLDELIVRFMKSLLDPLEAEYHFKEFGTLAR